MRKLTILCDMDSIIVNLTQKWLDLYNKDHNDSLTVDDMVHWDMAHNVKIGRKIYDYLYSHEFFKHVDPIPGALEALKEIHGKGHNLVVLSAPSWPGTSASDKISWIKHHLPWFNKRDIILGHNKHLVKGDVFIDDSPSNITAYRAHWPQSKIMTISYPYNQGSKQLCDVFAESHRDTEKAWEQIRGAIRSLE